MADEKLKDLTPVQVNYAPGERPTHLKLEGVAHQFIEALDFLEFVIGDAYGTGGNSPKNWINNLSRDIGNRDAISPKHEPDVIVENYEQTLSADQNEHELDLIPVGSGSGIIANSTDTSVVPAQFKNEIASLEEVGDWTLAPGLSEATVTKNSRKLVTYSPSTGGTITLTEATTGHGDAYNGAGWNVIPTEAQASSGGPFLDVQLLDPIENTYLLTLPVNNINHNRLGETGSSTLSNTKLTGSGRQMEFPAYFFDSLG